MHYLESYLCLFFIMSLISRSLWRWRGFCATSEHERSMTITEIQSWQRSGGSKRLGKGKASRDRGDGKFISRFPLQFCQLNFHLFNYAKETFSLILLLLSKWKFNRNQHFSSHCRFQIDKRCQHRCSWKCFSIALLLLSVVLATMVAYFASK
jgi:hypothetical protein